MPDFVGPRGFGPADVSKKLGGHNFASQKSTMGPKTTENFRAKSLGAQTFFEKNQGLKLSWQKVCGPKVMVPRLCGGKSLGLRLRGPTCCGPATS